ncbi:MAG: hypothetical protein LC734_06400, partial [Acidobacteria bacterium]|nr:hypothetical protein [Acidobacteriota bacterium]
TKLLIDSERFAADDATLAARISRGSVGKALVLDIEAFRAARELMLDVLNSAIAQPNLAAMLHLSETITDAKNRERFEEYLEILTHLIRDVWTISGGADQSCLINADLARSLKLLAAKAEFSKLAEWLDEIGRIRETLVVNINRRVAADSLFVSMAN